LNTRLPRCCSSASPYKIAGIALALGAGLVAALAALASLAMA
jgi:hypothetical protein